MCVNANKCQRRKDSKFVKYGQEKLKKNGSTHTDVSFSGYFDSGCLRWRGWEGWVLEGMEENKKSASPKIKLRMTQKMAHRVYQGWHVPTCGGLPQPTLSRLTALAATVSKLRFRLRLSLAWRNLGLFPYGKC